MKCRWYRIIPDELFLEHFASDRSHMVGTGAVYPPYPCIAASGAITFILNKWMAESNHASSKDLYLPKILYIFCSHWCDIK